MLRTLPSHRNGSCQTWDVHPEASVPSRGSSPWHGIAYILPPLDIDCVSTCLLLIQLFSHSWMLFSHLHTSKILSESYPYFKYQLKTPFSIKPSLQIQPLKQPLLNFTSYRLKSWFGPRHLLLSSPFYVHPSLEPDQELCEGERLWNQEGLEWEGLGRGYVTLPSCSFLS